MAIFQRHLSQQRTLKQGLDILDRENMDIRAVVVAAPRKLAALTRLAPLPARLLAP